MDSFSAANAVLSFVRRSFPGTYCAKDRCGIPIQRFWRGDLASKPGRFAAAAGRECGFSTSIGTHPHYLPGWVIAPLIFPPNFAPAKVLQLEEF